ncbi:LysE family translocator [Bordetella sp. 2513F-2]
MNPAAEWALLSPALLGPLALFVLVTSITPGPNNVMLASSGLTFGFRRSIPHMLGVNLGFTLMLVLLGLGLGAIFRYAPWLYDVMKYAGGAYLLYLAWRIAMAGPLEGGAERGRPLTFLQAALFQWVNPKAWIMTTGVITAYTPQQGYLGNLLIAAVVCCAVGLPSIGVWVLCGGALRRWLHRPRAIRAFNLTMAALLVASLAPTARDLAQRLAA